MAIRVPTARRRAGPSFRNTARVAGLLAMLFAAPRSAPAQLISIKTVPIAQGDQFNLFPSQTLGMGGVSIAVPDTLLDPFVNPAKGTRLGAARVFGSPAVYSVSNEAGGGRSLPLAALLRSGDWFGGLSLALQEVDASQQNAFPGPIILRQTTDIQPPEPAPDLGPTERSHGNRYALAMAGRTFESARLSVGGSLFWADLSAVDGVDMLYAGSSRISQNGGAVDLRVGILKELPGDRSLEVLAVHNRFGMTHEVTYIESFWDPGSQQFLQRARLEQNLDRTNTWGLHFEYERPLAADGWRIGWLATVNRMTHPKIPNYQIMSIPRDPGYSWAFNLGVGVSRAHGGATFGIDAIYEPIRSETWADAASPIENALGDTIPAGGKTIENSFRFSNALFRMGVTQQMEVSGLGRAAAVQLGLVVRSIRYRLDQYDNVQLSFRTQYERWTEWSPTWGLSLRFPELEIRYVGSVLHGTGRPGVAQGCCFGPAGRDAAVASGGIIAAPSGPLTLAEVRVVSHQISLSLPIR